MTDDWTPLHRADMERRLRRECWRRLWFGVRRWLDAALSGLARLRF